jgi:hypothetical protein
LWFLSKAKQSRELSRTKLTLSYHESLFKA